MKIAIDIGHANNTGSRGNGLEEHAVAVTIAECLAPMLRQLGAKVDVIDFPGMSNAQDLNATIKAANEGGYDFGISLHCDSASTEKTVETETGPEIINVPNPGPHGAHVCFYPGSVKGSRLAMCIAEPLSRLLPGRANTVQSRPGLAVLKRTRCPWVLCECGFITNPENAALMKDHPEAIAEAIAEGVKAYSKL